jgi:2-polyprenyl-3-methyl-5-hydroxy-6-metoxy-1,4-benzoquinol methylase
MTHTETAATNWNNALQGAMPLLFVEFSEVLGRYDDTREDAAAIARLIPASSFTRLLDICCGVGRLSHALADLGYDVLGIDLSIEQLEVARQSASAARFSYGDMADPPWPTRR